MSKSDLKQALLAIEPRTKAAKVRELMPVIEERISAGVRIAEILEVLNVGGLELNEATLKSYLYRYRKSQPNKAADQKMPASSSQTSASEPANKHNASVSYDTETQAFSTSSEPLSIQELDRLMKPDPAKQAEELAHYERLAQQQRRRSRAP